MKINYLGVQDKFQIQMRTMEEVTNKENAVCCVSFFAYSNGFCLQRRQGIQRNSFWIKNQKMNKQNMIEKLFSPACMKGNVTGWSFVYASYLFSR